MRACNMGAQGQSVTLNIQITKIFLHPQFFIIDSDHIG